MTILFYKRLTINPEIGNTTIWVLPNICRLGWVRDTKFGMNVSNALLLNAAKCQGYSFYRFWVKGKPIGGKITPTQIRVKSVLTDLLVWPSFNQPIRKKWSAQRILKSWLHKVHRLSGDLANTKPILGKFC